MFGAQRRFQSGCSANPSLTAPCLRTAQLSKIAWMPGPVSDGLAVQRVQGGERIAIPYRLQSRIVGAGSVPASLAGASASAPTPGSASSRQLKLRLPGSADPRTAPRYRGSFETSKHFRRCGVILRRLGRHAPPTPRCRPDLPRRTVRRRGQRQTIGLAVIAVVPSASSARRMISARLACFNSRLPFPATASDSLRCSYGTSTPFRIVPRPAWKHALIHKPGKFLPRLPILANGLEPDEFSRAGNL